MTATQFHLGIAVMIMALAVLGLSTPSTAKAEPSYDLVLTGGRVVDPANQLDAVRNIGIAQGRIAAVSSSALKGKQSLDVTGLVVAPGFIDLHSHGTGDVGQQYQARDGVTTLMDLEVGKLSTDKHRLLAGPLRVNVGHSTSYFTARKLALTDELINEPRNAFFAAQPQLTAAQTDQVLALTERSLQLAGSPGIGFPLGYFVASVSVQERHRLFQFAAAQNRLLFIHIHQPDEPENLSGLTNIIQDAKTFGTAVHICHITSVGLWRTQRFLEMIDAARADGVNITTEMYPYTAGSTGINAAILKGDWRQRFGMRYQDLEWPRSGVRFTGPDMLADYRRRYPDSFVVLHKIKEDWVKMSLKHPQVMVASDSITLSFDKNAHPRGMGTYSRVLGHYVREQKLLSLTEAINKMSTQPAHLLAPFVPSMQRKGHIGVNDDADIVIFDEKTIIDNATFQKPHQFSTGVKHLLVGGQFVVRDEQLIMDSFPGRLITTMEP
jgi:Amidohydrolase family